ncbi:MAG TPA: contact-dependent growth inhibition system immunity protein [Rhizomicrobium sp.]|nr:contact-dependent growth inhibition system immunity protein [Rhizomicrobium sp.]
MTHSEDDTLRQLFGAYLHQDMTEEFGDVSSAIDAMIASETEAQLDSVSKELRALLSAGLSDRELGAIMLDRAGAYYDPTPSGQSYHQWLSGVLDQIEKKLGRKDA